MQANPGAATYISGACRQSLERAATQGLTRPYPPYLAYAGKAWSELERQHHTHTQTHQDQCLAQDALLKQLEHTLITRLKECGAKLAPALLVQQYCVTSTKTPRTLAQDALLNQPSTHLKQLIVASGAAEGAAL
jgi:hypothetical protein